MVKENSIATAGVLGGVAGLLLGGFWPLDRIFYFLELGAAGARFALAGLGFRVRGLGFRL